MFESICDKFLPIYINLCRTYTLALWSAPVRYSGQGVLPDKNETAWEALRITIRNEHSPKFVIKKGTI